MTQQQRILDKVWNMVERVMGEMKRVLTDQLKDPTRSVDEQEKTLEYESILHTQIVVANLLTMSLKNFTRTE